MTMRRSKNLKTFFAAGVSALALGVTGALGQEDGVEEIQDAAEDASEETASDNIVVTGSRIVRKEFTSAAPVQVIRGDVARESGLLDLTEILLTTPQSTGNQIDQTFIGFVLDNGPGATQVNFRGLDPERTLVLVNGRRLAPAGVGGAPTTPDVSLIPTILVDRIENLFDGASSVYGSDAIAGVANVILRRHFEGFQIDADLSQPFGGGADQYTISGAWGVSGDDGFLGFGAEYQKRNRLQRGQRDYLGCENELHVDENGDLIRLDLDYNPGVTINECSLFPLTNRMSIPTFGSIYYTPGRTNVSIPNFSETQLGSTFDFDGDGLQDVDFKDPFYAWDNSPKALGNDFLPDNQTFTVYSYGEYETDWYGGLTPFFEAMYSNRQTFQVRDGGQLFPSVPAANPFNPCNNSINDNGTPGDTSDDYPNNPDGVNCLSEFGVDAYATYARGVISNLQACRAEVTACKCSE